MVRLSAIGKKVMQSMVWQQLDSLDDDMPIRLIFIKMSDLQQLAVQSLGPKFIQKPLGPEFVRVLVGWKKQLCKGGTMWCPTLLLARLRGKQPQRTAYNALNSLTDFFLVSVKKDH